MKRQLTLGKITVEEALWHEAAERLTIGALLRALPRWGERRVEALLKRVPVADKKRVAALTDRQKRRVVALMVGEGEEPRRRPRTDVEVVVWLGGRHDRIRVTRRHLREPGQSRTLCGREVPLGATMRPLAQGVGDCQTCWTSARW